MNDDEAKETTDGVVAASADAASADAASADAASADAASADAADDGAVAAAKAWVAAVMDDRDLEAAWPLTEPSYRKVLAQHWIISKPADVVGPAEQWEPIADGLAACPSTHRLWTQFASERLSRWREYWAGFSAVTWGVRTRTDPRPDVAVVTFVEPRGKLMSLRPGPPLEFRHIAVRRTPGGWLVAGADGNHLFRPGWPPGPG